jgi:hypothetical protein
LFKVKPLQFFREVAVQAARKGVSRITIITDKLEVGSVSEEYVERVAQFFRDGESPYADLALKRVGKSWPLNTVVSHAPEPPYS